MTKPPEHQPQQQQQQQKQAVASSNYEIDRLVEARTRELSALSSHLQSLAEKEKSTLARTLHDELGGLLTAAKNRIRIYTPHGGSLHYPVTTLKGNIFARLERALMDNTDLFLFESAFARDTYQRTIGTPAGLVRCVDYLDAARARI